jgi:hypothetical protein
MWEWLQGLSGGAATFLGSAIGSAVGLIAILIGAVFNAHLDRRRRDRIRREERRGLAIALRTELGVIARVLEENARNLKDPGGDFTVPDISQSLAIMPQVIPKLCLLDVDAIQKVLEAYDAIEQYCERLLLRGGKLTTLAPRHRKLVLMREQSWSDVAIINDVTATKIREAMFALARHL